MNFIDSNLKQCAGVDRGSVAAAGSPGRPGAASADRDSGGTRLLLRDLPTRRQLSLTVTSH